MSAPKRRPSLSPEQMAFTFDAPPPPRQGELAGLDRLISAIVARVLKEDERSRDEIAGAMSALLGEPVSKEMVDAYASEARSNHNIPAHRLLALIAATDRHDALDVAVRRAGGAVFWGAAVDNAHAGHLRAVIRNAKRDLVAVEARMKPIDSGERGRR